MVKREKKICEAGLSFFTIIRLNQFFKRRERENTFNILFSSFFNLIY